MMAALGLIAMSALSLRSFHPDDESAVIALWHECGLVRPWNDPQRDIARKLTQQPELFLVGTIDGQVVATAMIGYDGHRGWVYYVAVAPDQQRRNFGGAIMQAAEDWLRARGIEKLQLMVRPDNTAVNAFYESLGFGEQKRVIYAKWLDGRPLTP